MSSNGSSRQVSDEDPTKFRQLGCFEDPSSGEIPTSLVSFNVSFFLDVLIFLFVRLMGPCNLY